LINPPKFAIIPNMSKRERRVGHGSPEIIVGDGIVLKPVTVADSQEMFNLVRNWPDYLRHFWGPFEPGCQTLNDWRIRNSNKLQELKSFVIRGNGILMGEIEVGNLGGGEWNIGFWVGPQYTGRGYARRAVTALADNVFRMFGAQRINAFVDKENLPGKAVLTDTGFKFAGLYPDIPDHFVYTLDKPGR
jgi:ribosomal-protein-alanine N-acetyltransferase